MFMIKKLKLFLDPKLLGLFIFTWFLSSLFSSEKNTDEKISEGCPHWMSEQVSKDLAPFQNQTFSYKDLDQRSLKLPADFFVVKFTIKNNSVFVEKKSIKEPEIKLRASIIEKALKDLTEIAKLPDVVLYIALFDGYNHFYARLTNFFQFF